VSRKRNKTRRPGEYSGHFDGIGRSLTRIRKERTAVIQEAYIHGVSTPMACAKCSAWRSGPRRRSRSGRGFCAHSRVGDCAG